MNAIWRLLSYVTQYKRIRFLRQMVLVIALVVNQIQKSYPGTIHSLEICWPPPLLDMFIACLALRLFPEKSGLQHRLKVDWLSRSHTLLRSKSHALWDLSAMATFGLVASMAAHAYCKCASPSSLDKLEFSLLSSWWACSTLTNFFRVLICLVNNLIDFKLETDLLSSESCFALPFLLVQHLAGCLPQLWHSLLVKYPLIVALSCQCSSYLLLLLLGKCCTLGCYRSSTLDDQWPEVIY